MAPWKDILGDFGSTACLEGGQIAPRGYASFTLSNLECVGRRKVVGETIYDSLITSKMIPLSIRLTRRAVRFHQPTPRVHLT